MSVGQVGAELCAPTNAEVEPVEGLAARPVYVRYLDGEAHVRIGTRSLAVERRDDAGRTHTCPLELVTAALGS